MKNTTKLFIAAAFLSVGMASAQSGVGVGTTTPATGTALHVDGAKDNTSATPTATQAANDVVVNSTGKVGIGTTTPGWKLDVEGVAKVNSLVGPAAGNFHIDSQGGSAIWLNFSSGSAGVHIADGANGYGNAYAAAFNVTSDRRLKTDVKKIESALAIINQLNPVSYNKKGSIKSNNYDVKEMGFIAQELQQVLPIVVSETISEDKLLSVNYISIIPLLTKAIQEQQAQIEALKAELAKK